MKFYILILTFLFSLNASCQTNTVMICTSSASYAYHDHRCAGLNRCQAKVETISISKAKSMGRTPCGFCYKGSPSTGKKQPVKPSAQGQCTAITKKGTQCSRKARSDGKCWQHGG